MQSLPTPPVGTCRSKYHNQTMILFKTLPWFRVHITPTGMNLIMHQTHKYRLLQTTTRVPVTFITASHKTCIVLCIQMKHSKMIPLITHSLSRQTLNHYSLHRQRRYSLTVYQRKLKLLLGHLASGSIMVQLLLQRRSKDPQSQIVIV